MVQIKRDWFDTALKNYERGEMYGRLRTDRRRYTEKVLVGNGILRTRSSIVSTRYGMWECRKNWIN